MAPLRHSAAGGVIRSGARIDQGERGYPVRRLTHDFQGDVATQGKPCQRKAGGRRAG